MQKVVKSIKIRATEHDTGHKLPALTTNHDTTKVQTAGHDGGPTTPKGIFHGMTTKRGARLRARPNNNFCNCNENLLYYIEILPA